MRGNEKIYWLLVVMAWVASIFAFNLKLTITEGTIGSLALWLGAIAVWALHKEEDKEE